MAHSAEGAPARLGPLGSAPEGLQNRLLVGEQGRILLWSSLLLAVAAAFRLYALDQNSLWVDEYASLVTARLPLADIPAAALTHDAFEPPLYFWLLHVVIAVLGDSETALRLLSAVTGAITIPIAALLLRAIGGSTWVAIFGALFLAISPLHLWYSQEARPYALVACLGLGSLLCLLRAHRTSSALAWAGFAVLASLAILSHLTALVFVAIGLVWSLTPRPDASVLRGFLAAFVMILLATAPFGYRLAQAVSHAQGTGSPPRPLIGMEIPYTMFTYLVGYSYGPSVRDIQDKGALAAILAHPGQSAVAALVLLGFLALALRLKGNVAKQLGVLYLLPLTATWLGAALTTKAYNVRYTLPGVVGFLGLVALSLSGLRKAPRSIATALVAGLLLWADAQWFFDPGYQKEDSRSAVAWLREQLAPGSSVAVAPGYQAEVLAYYARRQGADLVFRGLPDTVSSLASATPDALLITRLHHLPHWRELVRSLNRTVGIPPRAVDLVSYRAFLVPR